MSTWIHITNLPLYYDEYGLQDIFSDIGQIIALNVTKNEMILKSTGFVQFSNPKHAKLAASKKDQTVIGNSAIRVYLIWTPKEDLSTIKVENIPLNISTLDLENNFVPYGQIVDTTICKNNNNKDDEKQDENNNNNTYALISYCRVDYALQAVQEMNNTILDFGAPLIVNLVNPDARNLKWKRNSFEYKILNIPSDNTYINNNYNQNHRNRKHHRHHHHHHNNNNNTQSHHQSNPNIIIVNNIGSIHNNNDDMKQDDNGLLHPSYPYNKHRNNNNKRYHSQRGYKRHSNQHNNNQYDDDINNYHHRHYRNNRHHHHHNRYDNSNKKQRKPRKFRGNSTRNNNITSQSTLLGPLHNESGGQYRTYSVTPSPTRSISDDNNNNNTHLNVNQIGLQRMNSADSNSSNSSVQSLPANYPCNNNNIKRGRGALQSYGFPSKQIHQTHHSPQPYIPNQTQIQTPVSPASTSGLSTPSTTHSMPTPPTYNFNNNNLITRSKTPTPNLYNIQNNNTPTRSSTTPISNIGTPPLSVPIPQIIPNMNIINGMNAMTINNIHNINHLNGMISPTSLMFPNLDTLSNNNMNKSPQSQTGTSPIVITPSQHNLLLKQQFNNNNKNMLQPQTSLSPPNTQSNFLFHSSPTLQGPFNTPPFNTQTQKRFVFNNNTNNINNMPNKPKNKKCHQSHNWTPKEEELGNKLYQMISKEFPQRATKIVGMLLTANNTKDIEWMIQKPHILMAVANDYNQKQQKKELNKK